METERLYYKDAYLTEFEARVISCMSCEEKKNLWLIELDSTAFYPEGGGQPADTGWLYIEGETVPASSGHKTEVVDVQEVNGHIYHICDDRIDVDSQIHGSVDWERRFDYMQQHSGEHIVSGMICESFGCDNVGFHLGAEAVVIDYNAEISMEALLSIEERANRYIWKNHGCEIIYPGREELKTLSYRSKKELLKDVRIVSFPGADTCACCGLHVSRSAEVGLVKFISCQRFTKGTRIELLCGKRAYDFLRINFEQNSEIARAMASGISDTAAIYHKQREEVSRLKLKYSRLEAEYFECIAEKYRDFGDIILFTAEMEPDSLRKLAVMVGECCGGLCGVFARDSAEGLNNVNKSQNTRSDFVGNIDSKNTNAVECNGRYKYAVVYKNHDIKELINRMNEHLNGRGGGKGGFAQGAVYSSEEEIRNFLR